MSNESASCAHSWEAIRSEDFGEMDYSSYGGGVNPFVVTLYRCELCGALKKEYTGDFCGDPGEFLEITGQDIAYAEDFEKDKKESRKKRHWWQRSRKDED